ncbi:MAG: hypothetical protein GY830_09120 [Bacteroidetes bacterium]|nr:hypothetical protein [Bacteroidota bacterium]
MSNDLIKPKFKQKSEIENEALGMLYHYNKKYLDDLNTKIDTYDFITEFIPQHIKKVENENIKVSFENLSSDLAGYTQYDKIVLNREKYDSDNLVDENIMNWTIAHEVYHRLYHIGYLLPLNPKQLILFNEENNKLKEIRTLNRDLQQSNNTNYFCLQANMFASYFLLPKSRLKKALLEAQGKEIIEVKSGNFNLDLKEWASCIAGSVRDFFNLNIQPIAIALVNYGLVKEKDKNLSLFDM